MDSHPAWRVALLDLDGTLCLGTHAIPGAPAFVERLRRRGMQPVFFTNNATRTPDEVSAMLRACGIACTAEEVCTAAQAAAHVLAKQFERGACVAYIGMNGLRQALEVAGLMPIAMDDAAEAQRRVRAAVMGLDRAVTYPKLAWFCRHVERLGAYVLTNGDLRVPMEDGFVPGNGAIGKLVTATTGIEPYVAGKPNKAFVRFALQRFGASEAEAVLVGDNLATDIAAGRSAGVYTIWVGTGVTAAPAVDETGVVTPDARCDSVADLFR